VRLGDQPHSIHGSSQPLAAFTWCNWKAVASGLWIRWPGPRRGNTLSGAAGGSAPLYTRQQPASGRFYLVQLEDGSCRLRTAAAASWLQPACACLLAVNLVADCVSSSFPTPAALAWFSLGSSSLLAMDLVARTAWGSHPGQCGWGSAPLYMALLGQSLSNSFMLLGAHWCS
jgi:hypothetical protein